MYTLQKILKHVSTSLAFSNIQVFDFDKRKCIWEQELYNELNYRVLDKLFHSFEADSCVAGLSFASQDEADTFRRTIDSRQKKRQSR